MRAHPDFFNEIWFRCAEARLGGGERLAAGSRGGKNQKNQKPKKHKRELPVCSSVSVQKGSGSSAHCIIYLASY